jgi:hypothetical protein
MANTYEDRITSAATAFSTWESLRVAMLRDGYVPSLRASNKAAVELGRFLEGRGMKVFWL